MSDFDESWEETTHDGGESHEEQPNEELVLTGDVSADFVPAVGLEPDTAPDLTYDEAKSLTEHIRATTDVLYVLIQKAHAGRAWIPLGYTSFGDYVNNEFSISRSRAYQLLNQANIIEQIEAVAPEGTKVSINEASARELKSLVDEIVPDIARATEGLTASEAGDVIEEMIREQRERFAATQAGGESYDEELAGDLADREGFSSHEGGGNYQGGPGNGPVEYGEAEEPEGGELSDEDLDNLFAFDTDPRETRIRLESVYNLYNALSALKTMPDFKQLSGWIPAERRVQVSASLPVALEWLTQFSQEWNSQEWAQEVETFGEDETVLTSDDRETEDEFNNSGEEDIFAELQG